MIAEIYLKDECVLRELKIKSFWECKGCYYFSLEGEEQEFIIYPLKNIFKIHIKKFEWHPVEDN
jgi:hypothetical protein